jgi:hypothetical protein
LINGILQVYNLGTAYMGALVVDKAGRRVLFLTSTAGMCVSYAIWTACAATYAKSYTEVDAAGFPIGANTGAGNGVLAAIFFCESRLYIVGTSLISRLWILQHRPQSLAGLLHGRDVSCSPSCPARMS